MVEFDALRRMVGMPPVVTGAEIEQIVGEGLHSRRGGTPVRTDMGANDEELCLPPSVFDHIFHARSIRFHQSPAVLVNVIDTGNGDPFTRELRT